MNFKTGQTVFVRNIATGAKAAITIHDIFEYEGQALIYGTRGAAPLWLPSTRGRWVETPGPVSWPFLPAASAVELAKLTDTLSGLPLVIELGAGKVTPMANSSADCGLWPAARLNNQADHLLYCRNVVDVWLRWKRTRDLRGALRYVKATWKGRARRLGVPELVDASERPPSTD